MHNCVGVSSVADLLGLEEDAATPPALSMSPRNVARRARRNSETEVQRANRLANRRLQRRLSEGQMATPVMVAPLTPTTTRGNVDQIRRDMRVSGNEERTRRRQLELASRRLNFGKMSDDRAIISDLEC